MAASAALTVRLAVLGGLLAMTGSAVVAQTLYKYQAPDGQWVYSDRWPLLGTDDASGAETGRPTVEAEPAASTSGIRLARQVNEAGEPVLVAINEYRAWTQIAFQVDSARNLDPDSVRSGNRLLAPQSITEIMSLAPIDAGSDTEVAFSYQYIYGRPGAEHLPEEPYRLPYALESAYLVSQAWPDLVTHSGPANRYAVDFEMPVGTLVFAARGGTVIDVVDDFSGAGLDPERDTERANFVRVLHDDGTLALYGHLMRDSIRVEPGQRIERGAWIAASGNTGFSSGPHLHFVVQRNRGGEIESVPVLFAGQDQSGFTPVTGDRPVAY